MYCKTIATTKSKFEQESSRLYQCIVIFQVCLHLNHTIKADLSLGQGGCAFNLVGLRHSLSKHPLVLTLPLIFVIV